MLPSSIAEYVNHSVRMGTEWRLALRDAVRFYRLGELPPNYPVPATLLDCTINHEQWRVQQYLNNR